MQKMSGPRVIPSLKESFSACFTKWEGAIAKDGKVAYADGISTASFQFVIKGFTGRDPLQPGENSLGGYQDSTIWLLTQIGPISNVPVPRFLAPLVELFLHTLPIPPLLGNIFYKKLENFYRTYATELLDMGGSKFGLNRDECLHNLIFLNVFNAYGGVNILFPSIVNRLGSTSADYQKELVDEVAKALENSGGEITPTSLGAMPLVESAVYEVLRIDPPVPFQYGRAKEDLVIESHEARFQVKKGEMIHGYMPTATHDPKVFQDPATFLPKRFLGEEGQKLLQYVIWSNGPQTEEPSVANKHCAGKHYVILVARAFVAFIYSKYQSIAVDSEKNLTALVPIQK